METFSRFPDSQTDETAVRLDNPIRTPPGRRSRMSQSCSTGDG
jgi:hypothetical protein